MSAPVLRPNACTSKRRFSCRWAAEAELTRVRRLVRAGRYEDRGKGAPPIATYVCRRCSGWHLSTRTREQVEAARQAAIANNLHYALRPDGSLRSGFQEAMR